MKNKTQITALLFGLTALSSLAFMTTVVLTRYPGVIEAAADLRARKGYIIIDGRTIDRPALLPAKQPTSPVPRDRTLGK